MTSSIMRKFPITISLDPDTLEMLDAVAARSASGNRSEAVRQLLQADAIFFAATGASLHTVIADTNQATPDNTPDPASDDEATAEEDLLHEVAP
jgi:Arc/MetJ-type ribon-helix-helix transcriptional regulator